MKCSEFSGQHVLLSLRNYYLLNIIIFMKDLTHSTLVVKILLLNASSSILLDMQTR